MFRKFCLKNFSSINDKLVFLSFAAGIIAALSMPGYNLSILAWVGFIPLIIILSLYAKSLFEGILYSFSFGIGFNFLCLSWILGLHPLKWLGFNDFQSFSIVLLIWFFVCTYTSFFIALWGAVAYFAAVSKTDILIKCLIISLFWSIIMEKLLSLGEFGFPWAMIEYSQYHILPIVQYAQFIGGIGIGFIIIFFNSFIALNLVALLKKSINPGFFILRSGILLVCLSLFYFCGIRLLVAPDNVRFFTATVIQGNVSVEQEKMKINSLKSIKEFYLNEINKAPPGLVVIPEAAIFDFIRQNDTAYYSRLGKIAESQNKTLVIGALDYDYINDGPTNSAFVFDSVLLHRNINPYNKEFLVPFGEYVPFSGFLPEFLKRLAATSAKADYMRGNKLEVFKTGIGNIAPSICYEIIFPDIIKSQVNNGADILVNLSNLAWFHDSIIKDQFVAFGVFRAAEARKPLIISVNTGYSIFINYTGKIELQLPKNVSKTASVRIGSVKDESLFSKIVYW